MWLREGDSDSKILNDAVKKKLRRNSILELNNDRDKIALVEEVKMEVRDHF